MLIADCDGDCRNCDDGDCPEHYDFDFEDPNATDDPEVWLRARECDPFYRLMKYGYD